MRWHLELGTWSAAAPFRVAVLNGNSHKRDVEAPQFPARHQAGDMVPDP